MRNHTSFSKGFTVLEMLVVCAVALVILVLLSDMFIEALRRTNDGRVRVDMQQKAVFAINKWERDIEKTSQRALVVSPGDPYCVAMTQADSLNQYGSVIWQKSIICWAFKKSEKIWQRELYPPEAPRFSKDLSESNPYTPTINELNNLTAEVSGQEKIICDHVEDFSLTDRNGNTSIYGNPNAVQPFIFKLKLRRTLSTSQRTADFTIERRYTLRNNF